MEQFLINIETLLLHSSSSWLNIFLHVRELQHGITSKQICKSCIDLLITFCLFHKPIAFNLKSTNGALINSWKLPQSFTEEKSPSWTRALSKLTIFFSFLFMMVNHVVKCCQSVFINLFKTILFYLRGIQVKFFPTCTSLVES